jgi:hypothetical protein
LWTGRYLLRGNLGANNMGVRERLSG